MVDSPFELLVSHDAYFPWVGGGSIFKRLDFNTIELVNFQLPKEITLGRNENMNLLKVYASRNGLDFDLQQEVDIEKEIGKYAEAKNIIVKLKKTELKLFKIISNFKFMIEKIEFKKHEKRKDDIN